MLIKKIENLHFAGISTNGKHQYNAQLDGNWLVKTGGWEVFKEISINNGEPSKTQPDNIIRFEKQGKKFRFYINGHLAREGDYKIKAISNTDNVGFFAGAQTSIEVDYLKFEEL